MQRKHLIAFTLATIFMLLGFNMINNYFHEKDRDALLDKDVAAVTEISSSVANDTTDGSVDIASQPLGKQPKAIIDNTTSQIEQAQNVEQQRLEQMDNAQ